MKHRDFSVSMRVAARHGNCFGQIVGAFPAEHRRNVGVFGTGDAMVFQMEMPGVMSVRYLAGDAYVLSSDFGRPDIAT